MKKLINRNFTFSSWESHKSATWEMPLRSQHAYQYRKNLIHCQPTPQTSSGESSLSGLWWRFSFRRLCCDTHAHAQENTIIADRKYRLSIMKTSLMIMSVLGIFADFAKCKGCFSWLKLVAVLAWRQRHCAKQWEAFLTARDNYFTHLNPLKCDCRGKDSGQTALIQTPKKLSGCFETLAQTFSQVAESKVDITDARDEHRHYKRNALKTKPHKVRTLRSVLGQYITEYSWMVYACALIHRLYPDSIEYIHKYFARKLMQIILYATTKKNCQHNLPLSLNTRDCWCFFPLEIALVKSKAFMNARSVQFSSIFLNVSFCCESCAVLWPIEVQYEQARAGEDAHRWKQSTAD